MFGFWISTGKLPIQFLLRLPKRWQLPYLPSLTNRFAGHLNMPKIFELFGFPLNVDTPEAQQHRLSATCPFMGCDCDGGGNRYLSNINLNQNLELKAIWPARDEIVSGVCSIRLNNIDQPWIVCPRRLLVLGKRGGQLKRDSQMAVEQKILSAMRVYSY